MATTAWWVKMRSTPKFAVRKKNRCQLCGRARGFMRKFALCRICFRGLAHQGMLPGVVKASW